MADRVELAFRRAAERLIPEGSSVVAAVSGGGDSVALLHLLARWAPRRRVRLAVAHLDHGMRRGSASDRRFVEKIAAELSLPVVSDRRPVGRARKKEESPEEAARRVRRGFLLEALRKRRADLIATGHTLDDQAETVLMRLLRGAGPSSLAGMSERGPGPFVRPLLGLTRAELRGWLERRRLSFLEDPTNRDLRYDRNRLRLLVLPMLAETVNPQAARHLVQAAERLREDAALLDDMARRKLEALVRRKGAGGVEMDALALRRLPAALARRVLRLALERAGAAARRPLSRQVEALLALAAGPHGRSLDLGGGIAAARRGRSLRIGS